MFCFPFALNIHNIADPSDYADLRRGSAAARLLGLLVRVTSGTWTSECCVLCVLRVRSLCRTDHSLGGVLPNVMYRVLSVKPRQ
jgi:hypothetical protein